MSKRIYSKSQPLIPVDTPKVGAMYHVSWAAHGCVWRCLNINEHNCTAEMITPKSKKRITVRLSDLRHTRKAQTKILSQNNK